MCGKGCEPDNLERIAEKENLKVKPKLNDGRRDRQVGHQDVVIQWQAGRLASLARGCRKGFKDVLLGKVTVPRDCELLEVKMTTRRRKSHKMRMILHMRHCFSKLMERRQQDVWHLVL